jgi:hypothetical protein
MLLDVLSHGAVAGLVHFIAIGILYGNPVIDALYKRAMLVEPGVRKWPSKLRYLITQFLGTQLEVFVLTAAYLVMRPFIGAATLALVLAAVRLYPRFWNMWIQTTYPRSLLVVEFVNGMIGTFVIVGMLER